MKFKWIWQSKLISEILVECLKPKSFFYMHDRTVDGYLSVN